MPLHEKHLRHPKNCFCQVSPEELLFWARKRYIENISTLDLLSSVHETRQKEIISIVALLDADDEFLLEMMGDVNLPDHHILHCREELKKMIKLAAQQGTGD
jgi:hypothetical protein